MTENAGHGDRTAAPRATEVEVKFIILDIWIPTNGVL